MDEFEICCIIMGYYRRKLRGQTSDLWTDAATGVGRVREERERRRVKVERRSTREE